MVSCGNSNTGSKDDELSILDLLMSQDNFGDFDGDGISDDFGVEYSGMDDTLMPPKSHYPDGTCVDDGSQDAKDQIEADVEMFEKQGGGEQPDESTPVETPIRGCTDPNALNYKSNATQDDGSCVYPDPIPVTIPELGPPEAPLSKADAVKLGLEGYDRKGYPSSHSDLNGGGGDINGKHLGEHLPYYTVENDGTDGYFKWIEVFNYKNASWWMPKPRPIHIATKYWRTGGFPDNSPMMGQGTRYHHIGCNYDTVKDGMYTAGKCSEVKYLHIHTTGCRDRSGYNTNGNGHAGAMTDVLRHTSGAMLNKKQSCYPYNWVIRGNGEVSQMTPDARYGAHTNDPNNGRGVAFSWMCFKTPKLGASAYSNDTKLSYRAELPDAGTHKNISTEGTVNDFYSDTFRYFFPSDAQIIAIGKMTAIYIKRYPDIQISGHNQHTAKPCPMFWVPEWVRAGGVPGLDQVGIDKLVRTGGRGSHPDYQQYIDQQPKYGIDTFHGVAARELAKISNPAGIGGGSVPFPNSNTSNSNTPQPAGKSIKDMDCNEFKVYYDANWKNILPGIRTAQMNAMSPEDQEDLLDKTRDCIQ